MGLLEYVRVLRRRWTWLLASTIVVLAASAAWVASSPPSYSSTETLFYTGASQDSATDTRLNSYASLATSARLVDAIRRELALSGSTTDVARRIQAKAEPNTLIVTITAKDATAEGAQRLASAAARQLVQLSSSLETSAATSPSPSATNPSPSATNPSPSATNPSPSTSGQAPGRLVAADEATAAVRENTAVRIIGLGLVFGLIAGIVLALVREATDSRIRSPEQLHQLGIAEQTVVRIADAAEDLPTGQVAEGYRVLRTVLFRGGHMQPTSLVVSSCDPDHDLPGVAGALAVTFARAATRVALVSTDLRWERIGPVWARAEPGLGNVLSRDVGLADAVAAARQAELWLIPAGRRLPYPEDSLASIAMSEIVSELRAEFDLVIMDALPLTARADALSVAEATGAGVVLVVAEGKTRRQQVRTALSTLESLGAPVVAVALLGPQAKSRRQNLAPTALVTTAPVTTAPVTTAPVTTAPVTTATVTTATVTTATVTPGPRPTPLESPPRREPVPGTVSAPDTITTPDTARRTEPGHPADPDPPPEHVAAEESEPEDSRAPL